MSEFQTSRGKVACNDYKGKDRDCEGEEGDWERVSIA
jgi:hypothetical protein